MHVLRAEKLRHFLCVTGVVETGLFVGFARKVFFGTADSQVTTRLASPMATVAVGDK